MCDYSGREVYDREFRVKDLNVCRDIQDIEESLRKITNLRSQQKILTSLEIIKECEFLNPEESKAFVDDYIMHRSRVTGALIELAELMKDRGILEEE